MEEAAGHTELVLAGLLFAVAALVTAARVLNVPYPVFLVLGGLLTAFVPGVPDLRLDPELVLLIFLPPLLYSAAFFASLRELRRNVAPIGVLAVGLVIATAGAVAVIAHMTIEGLSWPAAFALGAIVSPTDPVAATAIASRIGMPQRVVTIVEGESLINDATALVLYKLAVGAIMTGAFSAGEAGGRFVINALGGLAIGLAVGWVVAQVRRRLDDPPVEITISLLTSYAAYLPAEEAGVSGVVAAVTVGLYMGSQTSRVTTPEVRLQGTAVWQILVFLLNSVLFVLIGLQLPTVVDGLDAFGAGELAWYAGAACLAVVITRLVWTFVFTYVPRTLSARLRERDPRVNPRSVFLIGWMGMRGAVSLAAALALPPFPERDLVVFIVFVVILVTLVVQGLSLPGVIHALGVERDDTAQLAEEDQARLEAAWAALERIDALGDAEWTYDDSVGRLRALYDYRARRFQARSIHGDDGELEHRSRTWARMTHEVIDAQRDALHRLRREGRIDDEVMRRVERDLDLEELRLLDRRSL